MDEMKRFFSINLKNLLASRNMSQNDLAKALNFNRTTVNTWCTGVAFPTTDKIQKIADYFGIGKSALIEDPYAEGNKSLSDMQCLYYLQEMQKHIELLNAEGMQKLCERAEELAQLPKYRKRED